MSRNIYRFPIEERIKAPARKFDEPAIITTSPTNALSAGLRGSSAANEPVHRNAILGSAVVTALLASFSVAFAAGTSEQRRACMGDATRFCAAEIPNVSRITSCMRTNFTKLSPACKAVMVKG